MTSELQNDKLNNMKSKYKKLVDKAMGNELRERAFKLYQQGLTTRQVGDIIKRSHQWVAYVVREKEKE